MASRRPRHRPRLPRCPRRTAPPAPAVVHPQPQLTDAIAHLRARGNGTHQLDVALHPAELGAVHVRAALHGDTLTITVSCADDAARQAVTAALPDLHSALGGLSGTATIDLDLRDTGRGHPQSGDTDPRGRATSATRPTRTPTTGPARAHARAPTVSTA